MSGKKEDIKEINKTSPPANATEPKKIPNYLKFVFGGTAG